MCYTISLVFFLFSVCNVHAQETLFMQRSSLEDSTTLERMYNILDCIGFLTKNIKPVRREANSLEEYTAQLEWFLTFFDPQFRYKKEFVAFFVKKRSAEKSRVDSCFIEQIVCNLMHAYIFCAKKRYPQWAKFMGICYYITLMKKISVIKEVLSLTLKSINTELSDIEELQRIKKMLKKNIKIIRRTHIYLFWALYAKCIRQEISYMLPEKKLTSNLYKSFTRLQTMLQRLHALKQKEPQDKHLLMYYPDRFDLFFSEKALISAIELRMGSICFNGSKGAPFDRTLALTHFEQSESQSVHIICKLAALTQRLAIKRYQPKDPRSYGDQIVDKIMPFRLEFIEDLGKGLRKRDGLEDGY